MQTLDKLNKLYIYSSFSLSQDDYSCLSLLYAPLVGSNALYLYLTIFSLIERNNMKSEGLYHQELLDLFGWPIEEFYNNRLKLEAIGLLTTYKNDKDEYIYLMRPPLTPQTFLQDVTFGMYLANKVGTNVYNYLVNHFEIEKIDKDEFENITIPFDQIFTTSVDDLDETVALETRGKYVLGKVPNKYYKVVNEAFDFDEFVKLIDVEKIEEGVVTEKFKRTIINASYVYSFTINQLAQMFNESINAAGVFDYQVFRRRTNMYFSYLHPKQTPRLAVKEDKISNEDFVQSLDNTSPQSLLEKFFGKDFPRKYLETAHDLYDLIDYPRGVVNCMIMYVITKNEGKDLPNAKYFQAVESTWKEKGIRTTSDAYTYITNSNKKPTENTKKPATEIKSRGYNKPKKESSKWVDDFIKNVKDGFDTL